MFQEMYGDVELDAATRRLVEEAWRQKTSQERKAVYEGFTKQVQQAEEAKNLSWNPGVSPEHLGEDEMQKTDVVRRFLFPAHEDAAVAVQPRVDTLDDPASRLVPVAALRLLFASRADVRRVATASGGTTDGFGVVAFVPAEMLFAPAARTRPRDGDAVESGFDEFLIVNVAPATANPMGMPRASVSTDRFTPSLPRSVGFFPVFFPTQRRLRLRPSKLCQRHAMPRRPS